MKRRHFLKTVAASAGLMPIRSLASDFLGAVAPQSYPVISGIDSRTAVPQLIAVLDAFWERNIPVTCLVHPFDETGRALDGNHALSRLLSGYVLGGSGIEIAPFVPDLASLSPHFQARAAHDALAALMQMLRPAEQARSAPVPIQTIACHEAPRPASPEAVRTAGLINVLVIPDHSAPTRSQTWDNGVVRLFGGFRSRIDAHPAPPFEEATTQTIHYLSAPSFSRLPMAEVIPAAANFAETLADQELEGRFSLLPLADLQLRDNYQFRRLVSLHILEPLPEETTAQAGFAALTARLDALEIPFTVGPDRGDTKDSVETGLWIPLERGATDEEAQEGWPPPHPIEFLASDHSTGIRTTRPLTTGIAVRFPTGPNAAAGLAADGALTLPLRRLSTPVSAAGVAQAFAGIRDLCVQISPAPFASAVALRELSDKLSALKADTVTTFQSLPERARLLAPRGPIPTRHRRVAAAQPGLLTRHPRDTAPTREELLEDAQVAWRYIERFTHPETGLCPATVNFSPGGRLHETVTMWDVGSQINALVAAKQIGLIDANQHDTAIRRILPNIVGRVSQDRRLPQGWIRTDRLKWGNKNFDGCDAGRLLAALDNLRRHSTFGDELKELIANYDLDKVIFDGEIHSVIDGTLKSTIVSHCAHYAALAFRRWGLEVRSPYEVFAGRSATDGQMALLEAAARIGPFGAEPLLLEAMELGMSPESAYLADVLFSTQIEEYQDSGRLICVSEGPIDRSPWFLYQGLQLDAPTRTWAMDTVGREPEYRTPEFARSHLAVSSKAAYLWSAYQPHAYSDRLRNFVRATAKTENGFSSSIFVETGQATKQYSDLNTNSIILQGIAHHLNALG
ncbi:DUF3131 domain-containing protein [Epibacterium sp. Ofav1-8]|uniref:DUF3131 domain-containing protein n=1 Tax=Epibacterium sp. Ofav1-8 TaxID=2917735 RepID=UPI001EF5A3FF|nr:DUF3131 domain-containing protein [Epibacterium sp. Ofav1-8]MCG7624632.1 DUF3131 domain-containing protein [Epibacterium sp. Ofav1-8]